MSRGEQQTPYFPLGGGMDLITPAISLKPGVVIDALNYEPVANGYRRADGFERFDGRPSPTDANYHMLNFDGGTAAFALGDTVTGLTSGATGKVLENGTVTSGTFASSDAMGYIGLGEVTGTFQDNEALQVAAITRAFANGLAVEDDSPDDATARIWQAQATANARTLIAAVPGSGDVRGVWEYLGTKYAWRDNAGGTAGAMWKSSAAGWVAVPLGFELDFTSGGTVEPLVGQTITGATSGATAVLTNVVVTSGDWTTGDAAGYFIMASATGTFAAENLNIGTSLDVATIAGDKVAITLPAGGRYDLTNHNFYGSTKTIRMYGCNGVGKAFEFDGSVFTPIRTGMAVDTPHRIAAHKKHLFLAFQNGILQNSETGNPLGWEVIEGAAAIGVGDEITDLIAANAGVLTILATNGVSNLYGSTKDDFQLETLSDEAGALPWTADKVGEPIYMDKRGVRRISSTQNYGNFQIGTLTQNVRPLLQDFVRNNITPVASVRVRNKDQYRVFFSNNIGLTVYLGKKKPEILRSDIGKRVSCICSVEGADDEEVYFGSDDGFVYQLDKGFSFDGEPIPYSLRLPFNHQGAPQQLKRWHKVVLECEAIPLATLAVSADFDYGDPYQEGQAPVEAIAEVFTVTGGGGVWDVSNWNQFYWSGAVEGLATAYLDGVGRNMSLLIAGSSADEPPHILQGLTLFYTVRGLQR